jgi:hypothetical protein
MSFLLQIFRTDELLIRSPAEKRYVEGDLYVYKIEASMCSDKCFKSNILTIMEESLQLRRGGGG